MGRAWRICFFLTLLTANVIADERVGVFLDVSSSVEADIVGYKTNALDVVDGFQGREVTWMYNEPGLSVPHSVSSESELRAAIARAQKKEHSPLESGIWGLGKSLYRDGRRPGRLFIQSDLFGGVGSQEVETFRVLQILGIRIFSLTKPRWEKDLGNAQRVLSAGGGLLLEYKNADELAQAGILMRSALPFQAEIGRTNAINQGEYPFFVDDSVQALSAILTGKGIESLTLIAPDGTPTRTGSRIQTATGLLQSHPIPGKWIAQFFGWGDLELAVFAQSTDLIRGWVDGESVQYEIVAIPANEGETTLLKLRAYDLAQGRMSEPKEIELSLSKKENRQTADANLTNLPRGEYSLVLSVVSGNFQREHRLYYSNTAVSPVIMDILPSPGTTLRQEANGVSFSFHILRNPSQLFQPILRIGSSGIVVSRTQEEPVGPISHETWEGKGTLLEGQHQIQLSAKSDFGEVPIRTWSFGLDLASAKKIQITEIHPEGKEGFWVELEGLADLQDISGYRIGTFNETLKPENRLATESVRIKKGQRVIIRWDERGEDESDLRGDINRNKIRELYIQSFEDPGRQTGMVVLRDGDVVLDAVVYRRGKTEMSKRYAEQVSILKYLKEWDGPPVQTGESNQSIGRKGQKDMNHAEDWTIFLAPTPGMQNVDAQIRKPQVGDIAINEVHLSDEKWAEIKVLKGPMDISFLRLSNLEGQDEVIAQFPTTLQTGELAVVRWDKVGQDETDERGDMNRNGVRDLYLADPPPFVTDDQLALMYVDQILDAVVWTNNDGEMSVTQVKDANVLLTTDQWIGTLDRKNQIGAVVLPTEKNSSIGRISENDANKKDDWGILDPSTPGKENTELVFRRKAFEVKIVEVQPKNDPWAYAILYVDSGEGDISKAVLTDLDGEDPPLAEERAWIKAGDRIWVTWGPGADETDKVGDANKNGRRDFYIENDQPPTATDDQLVLILEDKWMDVVCWANGDGKISSSELKDFSDVVSKGGWQGQFTTGDESGAILSGSIVRRRMMTENKYTDTERNGDWE